MESTGERFIPGMLGSIEVEHLHRYALARSVVNNLDVLDVASGEGYGTFMLGGVAKSVMGVDISNEAINFARMKYSGRSRNVRFRVGSCSCLPVDAGSVDAVVSFETIEHHADHDGMLSEIGRVLRPEGFLIISTPDKMVYSEESNYLNPYHVKELDRLEFIELLRGHFDFVTLYGQTPLAVSLVRPLMLSSLASLALISGSGSELVDLNQAPSSPMYLIAVCGKNGSNLPVLPPSVFCRS